MAFTLIEFLAAIAVLAVLASLIVAALSNVRQSAHKVQGVHAMRQTMQYVVLYAQDHDGELPGPLNLGQKVVTRWKSKAQLAQTLAPYFGHDANTPDGTIVEEMAPLAYLEQYEPDEYPPYYAVPKIYLSSSPADFIRPWGLNRSNNSGSDNDVPPERIFIIPDPARSPALADYDAELVSLETGGAIGVDQNQRITEPIYGTTRHVAFWDGRVESVPVDYDLFPILR